MSALRVCKEIYEEGTKLLYGHNEFVLNVRLDPDKAGYEVSPLFSTLEFARLDLVKFLTLTIVTPGLDGLYAWPTTTAIGVAIGKMKALKRIRLNVAMTWDNWHDADFLRQFVSSGILEDQEVEKLGTLEWLHDYMSSILQVLPRDTEVLCQDDEVTLMRRSKREEGLGKKNVENILTMCGKTSGAAGEEKEEEKEMD